MAITDITHSPDVKKIQGQIAVAIRLWPSYPVSVKGFLVIIANAGKRHIYCRKNHACLLAILISTYKKCCLISLILGIHFIHFLYIYNSSEKIENQVEINLNLFLLYKK